MNHLSRRHFLKTAAFGALAAPSIIPGAALGLDGAVAASERITMGLIGCGSHGAGWNLDLMFRNPAQQVIAVCDIDRNYLKNAENRVNGHYSQKLGEAYTGCTPYTDFRDLVNRADIDAVDIVTPDHWHTLLAVFAMKAGKDVICEKPTLTVREGRLLVETQKATGRVFQTASENRSVPCYQQMVNLARHGHLGEIRRIKVLLPPGNTMARDPNKADADTANSPQEVPAHIDYEMWTGPAPMKPYIPARHHYNWRWDFDYSGGVITDWGSHMTNLAQWVNDTDDTGPVSVRTIESEIPPRASVWNTAVNFSLAYEFANGVKMDVWTEVPGIKVEGTKGWLLSRGWRSPLKASDDKLLEITFSDDENFGRSECTADKVDGMGGEHLDFTNCVKSRRLCYYTAESGHRTHTIAHLGNISMLLGGAALTWNPETEIFEGERADEANAHFCFDRPQRDPWTFEAVDSWINVG